MDCVGSPANEEIGIGAIAVGDTELSAVTIVWNYVGELVFNLLVLVGAIKASDRIVREMMGLGG